MKSLGRELSSVAATLAIPAAVACIFPYAAVGFRAHEPAPSANAAAFVSLTADEETAAMRAAKASWQSSREGAMSLRADLSFGELPQVREPALLAVEARTRQPRPEFMEFRAPPFMPRLAAPPPPPIGSEPPTPNAPPFPRDELLRPGELGLGVR